MVVEAHQMPKTLSFSGVLVTPRDATVSSSRGGRVDAYAFDVGQRVRAGDVLVKLGAEELAFASQAAAASANQSTARIGNARDPASMPSALAAKAELDSATDAAQRAERLFTQGSASAQEMARQRANLAAAQARYHAALADSRAEFARRDELRAMAGQAQAALGDKAIRSPFDGIVLERFVEIGQVAPPNGALLRVVDPSELRVRFEVSQLEAEKVALGARVTALVRGALRPAHVVRTTPGLVGAGSARVIEARLDPIADDAPLPGMLVQTWLETGESEELVPVPRTALLETAGVLRAWVVEGDRLAERLLSVAQFEGDRVLVRRGLRTGDRVVKVPQRDFRLGEEVTP